MTSGEQLGLYDDTPTYPQRGATLSDCGQYRYALTRRWAPGGATCTFIMLNPSTADALEDDPTIRQCMGFAATWGCNALHVANVYAYRSTDPAGLWSAPDPVGPDNAHHLVCAATAAADTGGPVVAAWGAHAKPAQVATTMHVLDKWEVCCLGTTKGGAPRHPLYLPKTTELTPWQS